MATAPDTTLPDVRSEFPVLTREWNGKRVTYVDSAATSQKPEQVLAAMDRFLREANASVHRGLYDLGREATDLFEGARERIARFVGADAETTVFTHNATEAINLVAYAWARDNLHEGDEILVTRMEHHSNIVPWQLVCQQTGAALRVAPIDDAGDLIVDAYAALLRPRTKLVAVTHVSNALGSIVPLARVVALARAAGIPVLVDGAQAIAHMPVDVQALDCDFYAFSGHKILGPTGIGILYGKASRLEAMPPYQGGGDMIRSVTFERTVYNDLPYKFEAGTPNIAGAIGLGAALDYMRGVGVEAIDAHERALLADATARLAAIPGLRIIGTARDKAGIVSFTLEGVHAHDVGTILDHEGVAIRAGHHCAMPVMAQFGVAGTARASFALYNTHDEIDALVAGVERVRRMFR